MKRRNTIILMSCLIAVAAAAVVAWYMWKEKSKIEQGEIITNDHPTHGAIYFTDGTPQADSLLIGKWQNSDNPQWYKVYYDDYDEEEGLFWGKEWDESEDVFEEDMNYHGNGWFRWEKKGNSIREFATMDACDVPIAKLYTVLFSSADSLAYCEQARKKRCFCFTRVE